MSEKRLMKTPEELRQKARELLQMPKEDILTQYMFMEQEIERLNNIIRDLVRFAWGTDMSINEFNTLYEMAYNKEFEGFED